MAGGPREVGAGARLDEAGERARAADGVRGRRAGCSDGLEEDGKKKKVKECYFSMEYAPLQYDYRSVLRFNFSRPNLWMQVACRVSRCSKERSNSQKKKPFVLVVDA
jgi:hypothetical protein